jgi:hypothetical protein
MGESGEAGRERNRTRIYTDPADEGGFFLLFFSHLSNKAKAEEINANPFLTFSHFSPLSHFR